MSPHHLEDAVDRRRRRFGPVGRTLGAGGIGFGVSGCGIGVFKPQGPVGVAEKTILLDAIVIMLAIIVPTMIGTLCIAWHYRASNLKATYRPDWTYSGQIELVVWSVPLLTIIVLGGIAWVGAHQLDPAVPLVSDKKPVQVQVVPLDRKWLFIYPDQHIASINHLTIPRGTPITFHLTSSGVWNPFSITQLGSMIYMMKGMTTHLNLQADQEGRYHGLSTHFSGDGFPDMQFETDTVSPDDVQAWVTRTRGQGPHLNEAVYRDLLKQSFAERPVCCGS